jgi:hypothetical protein
MRVYMLQDVVTGGFYEGLRNGGERWGVQRGGKLYTDLREATSVRCRLKPFYTTIVREYTLTPCQTDKNS